MMTEGRARCRDYSRRVESDAAVTRACELDRIAGDESGRRALNEFSGDAGL